MMEQASGDAVCVEGGVWGGASMCAPQEPRKAPGADASSAGRGFVHDASHGHLDSCIEASVCGSALERSKVRALRRWVAPRLLGHAPAAPDHEIGSTLGSASRGSG